jgi:hypothetical protein
MLGLDNPGDDKNLSSRENFRRLYRDRRPENLYLTVPIQPYRMNERLTIQQGLFLCANHPLMGFHRCLKRLLDYAQERHKVSGQWLHKLVVESEAKIGRPQDAQQDEHQLCDAFSGFGWFRPIASHQHRDPRLGGLARIPPFDLNSESVPIVGIGSQNRTSAVN